MRAFALLDRAARVAVQNSFPNGDSSIQAGVLPRFVKKEIDTIDHFTSS
jgi:hypothetical protein